MKKEFRKNRKRVRKKDADGKDIPDLKWGDEGKYKMLIAL